MPTQYLTTHQKLIKVSHQYMKKLPFNFRLSMSLKPFSNFGREGQIEEK